MRRLQLLLVFSTLTASGYTFPFVASSQVPVRAANTDTANSETRGIAYQNGYQDGWVEGEAAWAHSRGVNLNENGNYKKAEHGYTENLGDKSEYKQAYRRGFEDGYSVGYGLTVGGKEKVRK